MFSVARLPVHVTPSVARLPVHETSFVAWLPVNMTSSVARLPVLVRDHDGPDKLREFPSSFTGSVWNQPRGTDGSREGLL